MHLVSLAVYMSKNDLKPNDRFLQLDYRARILQIVCFRCALLERGGILDTLFRLAPLAYQLASPNNAAVTTPAPIVRFWE